METNRISPTPEAVDAVMEVDENWLAEVDSFYERFVSLLNQRYEDN